ncbi:MAG: hypothetical protein IKO84_07795 [Butyrivibrio sp.]|nr:hypothetical protein [Butyrivibrio sp.]
MGNEIKHNPVTGEPMLPTEDLSQVELDPVLEFKLTQEEYAKRQQMNVLPPAGPAFQQNVMPPSGGRFINANPAWYAANAQRIAEKKIKDNKSKPALVMCIISLVLWIFARLLVVGLIADSDAMNDIWEYIYLYLMPSDATIVIAVLLIPILFIVPYILLIIIRVSHKYNKFGRALQWIYIGELILFVLLIRFAVLFI